MKRLFVLGLVVAVALVVYPRRAEPAPRERLQAVMTELLEDFPKRSTIHTPQGQQIAVETLIEFLQSPEFKALTDDDAFQLGALVRDAYRASFDRQPSALFDSVWSRVDAGLAEILKMAPDID